MGCKVLLTVLLPRRYYNTYMKQWLKLKSININDITEENFPRIEIFAQGIGYEKADKTLPDATVMQVEVVFKNYADFLANKEQLEAVVIDKLTDIIGEAVLSLDELILVYPLSQD